MKVARDCSACAVFDDRIVVSGGLNEKNDLNSVESYDFLPDERSSMPNMNTEKFYNSLVVVKNKLVVVSKVAVTCKVFDNIYKIFRTLKFPYLKTSLKPTTFENKIFIIQSKRTKLISYDTDNN